MSPQTGSWLSVAIICHLSALINKFMGQWDRLRKKIYAKVLSNLEYEEAKSIYIVKKTISFSHDCPALQQFPSHWLGCCSTPLTFGSISWSIFWGKCRQLGDSHYACPHKASSDSPGSLLIQQCDSYKGSVMASEKSELAMTSSVICTTYWLCDLKQCT